MAKVNYKKVAFHVLAWAAAFIISTILIPEYSLRVSPVNILVSWLLYIFVFYVNYLFLIPKFFRLRRMPFYVILAAAVLFGSFVIVRYTALETTRHDIEKLGEQLQTYDDVKDSFEEKERILRRQWEFERRRQWRERRPEEGGITPMRDSLREQRDSLLMAEEVTFTPREEEYGQRRREYEGMRGWDTMLSQAGRYNPFQQFNLQFIFALILFYLAAILVYFAEQGGKAEKHRREVEQERAKAELAYLKQQINPHFLFNTLNAIYSYTIGVSGEASNAVLKLSSILRYMLYETSRDRVPLSDELAVMADYIELQRLRITDKTLVEVSISGDPAPHRIEPMLLIPILENAFKYGVDSVEPSFVKIGIEVAGHHLTFRVVNRIVRRNESDPGHSGIGIQNIRRRLELIYGRGNYELAAGEKEGLFSVVLQLDLKE